jgi:hypothetical protein
MLAVVGEDSGLDTSPFTEFGVDKWCLTHLFIGIVTAVGSALGNVDTGTGSRSKPWKMTVHPKTFILNQSHHQDD